jgi:hypothetical protein
LIQHDKTFGKKNKSRENILFTNSTKGESLRGRGSYNVSTRGRCTYDENTRGRGSYNENYRERRRFKGGHAYHFMCTIVSNF